VVTERRSGATRLCRNEGAAHARGDLFEDGVIPAEVARQVGVSHQIVSDWRAAWRRSGVMGCVARVERAVAEVEPRQLAHVELELIKGPKRTLSE